MSTEVIKVWWDGEKLMAEPIPESEIYGESAQQQEPLPNDLQFAIESMIEAYKAGDLDGWEVQLVNRGLRICAHNIKDQP